MRSFIRSRNRWSVGLLSLGLVLAMSWNMASALLWQKTNPQQMIPEQAFLYCEYDGLSSHKEDYQKTAEHQAFVESGLADLIDRLITTLIEKDESGAAAQARAAAQDMINGGFVLAGSLPDGQQIPIPLVHFVFNEGGNYVDLIAKLVGDAISREGGKLELTEMGGRKVRHFIIPNSPGVQVAFWQEGDSLAAAFGPDVLTVTVECLAGNRSSLAANKKFQQQTIRSEEFAQSSLTWVDFGPLKSTYGPMPIPLPKGDPITVDDVLKLTGLSELDSIISRVGYKGAALWSESKVVGLGKADGAPMTLADLPPLPKKMNSFSAFRCNPEKALDQLMELVKNGAALAGEEQKVAGLLESLDDILGFRLKEDLVSQFGSLVCFYDDINGGLMGGGMTLVVQLNDGARTSQFIDQQMGRLEQAEEDGEVFDWPVYPYRIQLEGKPDLIVFDIFDAEETAIQMGAVQVIGNWLVISTMPQAVEAFRLRTEGRLATWTPDEEYQAAFAELPQEFTSITGASPREGYQLLLSLGTTFLPFLQKTVLDEFGDQFEELPFYLEEVPPAELIAQPLFPNVVVSVADADGATVYSRISTAGFPMGGGDMGMTTLAVGGVMAALLLPAVQSARGAARKAQAKNNLKQIGLAIHNYDSTYNHLPIGTIPNEDLKPEERFSWQTSILPYLEENGTYNLLDLAKPWNEDINEAIVAQSFPVFLDPNQGEDYSEYGQTHFVGMAGVGKNAPLLKVGQPGCGIFGYDRKVRFRDITDGTSNTMMVIQVNGNIGPWAQGGPSTIRGLTAKPYIDGPDGFGGANGQSTLVLMVDGSVREVSALISDKNMENLADIADGNLIDYDDF